ncbi:MAG: sigma-70 family RNA polymerase sigma factor [Bacilli bacterium]|nr:sigma-70 family RNA polymerase sigma factor [Bacilli bacterium]
MIDQETLDVFDKLYYSSYQDVLKYVICHCQNIDNVKDIIQNIYLDVFNKIKRDKKITINKFYILGIAKHKVNDYYRFNYKAKITSIFSRKKDNNEISIIDTIASDIDLESELIKEENINCVWNYLKRKNVIVSKIFYLYYYMDFSIKDIANELSISESNVKNYLYRTLKELNVLIKDRGE